MRIGSLFSGIGGLELGLEWAGLGPVIWQVEKDEFCRAVLAKHWPDAERFDDVCNVGKATLAPVDLICGGFPCQDVSPAGKRAGLAGARSGLWFEFRRVVSELRPDWVVVENVAGGANQWVDRVRESLEELRYVSLPIPLAANDVGAPQRRGRVFLVAANADKKGEPAVAQHAKVAAAPPAARAHCARLEGSWTDAQQGRQGLAGGAWGTPIPDVLRVADGFSRGLDRPRRRIEALGNSVVPQCAEVVGWVIRELNH